MVGWIFGTVEHGKIKTPKVPTSAAAPPPRGSIFTRGQIIRMMKSDKTFRQCMVQWYFNLFVLLRLLLLRRSSSFLLLRSVLSSTALRNLLDKGLALLLYSLALTIGPDGIEKLG